MSEDTKHKPVIETMINTCALAITSFGVMTITKSGDWDSIMRGACLIILGAGLEWFKYFGRSIKLW